VIVVTGGNGFVGRRLCAELAARGRSVRAAVRELREPDPQAFPVGDIDADTDWDAALAGAEAVIHCAARVHVMRDSANDPLAAFRAVNLEGTRRLAEVAAAAGVRRVVYLSSIKVNGESTVPGSPFRASDTPRPSDAYAVSKWEAEQALYEIAARTGLEVVVVRPPLVYGPGVRANFERLMRLVARGAPIPLGSVDNRRSMVGLDNLVDLLIRCVDHPAAARQTFLVSDRRDLSTPEWIRMLAVAMGRPARLLPVPPALLRLGGRLAGRGAEVGRLIDSLQLDIAPTCETLDWSPPVSIEEGLSRTVASFRTGAAAG
jgi:nucleoside-diphosphate-sugar epimerase